MRKVEPKKGNRKTGIVSLGTRISLSSNNVRSVDLKYLREYLMNLYGHQEVDFISKKTRKEKDIDYFKDTTEVDFNDYDEIYIYNSSLNPFGGLFKDEALDTFEKLYDYNGSIVYFLIDPKMPPIDFSQFLLYKNKKTKDYIFGSDAKARNFKRYIAPEIVDNWSNKVWNRVKIAFNGFNYEKYCNMWNTAYAKSKNQFKLINDNVDWYSLDLVEYYAVNEELDLKLKNYNKIDNPYELVYFGNNRQNERNKIIHELYDIPEFNKLCIGFDPELENTDVLNYLKHDELFETIGSKCLATVVVGDNCHNDNERTARFFESMLLDCVGFIYEKYDSKKAYINNEFLKDFIYISSKEQLKDRINQIKADPELYKKIVELERKDIIEQFEKLKF